MVSQTDTLKVTVNDPASFPFPERRQSSVTQTADLDHASLRCSENTLSGVLQLEPSLPADSEGHVWVAAWPYRCPVLHCVGHAHAMKARLPLGTHTSPEALLRLAMASLVLGPVL